MSDFERTFGAGADAASIIDGFAYQDEEKSWWQRASSVYFSSFEAALEYARLHPGNVLRADELRSGFAVDFEGRGFTLKVPIPESFVAHQFAPDLDDSPRFYSENKFYDPSASLEDLELNASRLGDSCFLRIKTPPPSFSKIEKSLQSIDLRIDYVSEVISLIRANDGSEMIRGVLLNKSDGTLLVTTDEAIYRVIMGIDRDGRQIRADQNER